MSGYANDGKTPVPQVLAQTWHTKLPVHLSLAPDNISSPSAVRPIYLMAPRQGYLNVVAAQAWPHLQHVLPSIPGRPGPPRPWFDCRGVPLKWHLPCGVLYDLLADSGQLPWRLTVHYTHPPDLLVGWHTGATPQAQFMNSLKEACYICRGPDGSGAVMRMGSAAQDELWAAVQMGDMVSYRAALDSLRVVPSQRQGQPPNIPVRLFLRRASPAASRPPGTASTAPPTGSATTAAVGAPVTSVVSTPRPSGGGTTGSGGSAGVMAGGGAATTMTASFTAGGGGLWETCITATSRPVPSQQGGLGGEPTTLAQLLHIVLPHIFPAPQPSAAVSAQQAADPGAAAAGSSAPTPEGSKGRIGSEEGTSVKADGVSSSGRGRPGGVDSGSAGVDGEAGAAEEVQCGPAGPAQARDAGEGGGGGGSGGSEGGAIKPGRTSASGCETAGEPSGAVGDPAATGAPDPSVLGKNNISGASIATADTTPGAAVASAGPVLSSTGAGSGAASDRGDTGPAGSTTTTIAATREAAAGAVPGGAPWPPCRVLVGGICPPMEAPIGWLYAAMHAPDLFLYVVVRLDGGGPPGLEGFDAGPGGARGVGSGVV